jgi:hypothetical protein
MTKGGQDRGEPGQPIGPLLGEPMRMMEFTPGSIVKSALQIGLEYTRLEGVGV